MTSVPYPFHPQMAKVELSRPAYDVVSVKPLSHYEVPLSYSGAEVRINRTYLDDYASLKGCAVVAVFYEERRCTSDEELEAVLDGKDGENLQFPGRDVSIMRDSYDATAPILCKIWGCRLVLAPSGRPISEEQDPELTWPGFPHVMTITAQWQVT